MLGGSASRVSIDSGKGCWAILVGDASLSRASANPSAAHLGGYTRTMPYLGAPQPYPGAPPAPPYPKPPPAPPYITFYPCPASPLSGAPWTGASNWGLRPEITMLAQCRNGARSQCFSMETQNLVVEQKVTMDGPTLKAQSVHQRWRKVCLTNNGVRKLFQQKRCFNWIILSDKYIMSNHYLISAGSSWAKAWEVHYKNKLGCFRGRLQNAWVPL